MRRLLILLSIAVAQAFDVPCTRIFQFLRFIISMKQII
uniref:Uncharacterized protein n=1 Tax=Heterorhabditis bacteriophora TaxID=37862 RepID=A0A1I7XCF2_HETBA